MLVWTPYTGYEHGVGTLDDMTSTRPSDRGQAMSSTFQRRRCFSFHGRSDCSYPTGVGVDDGAADGGVGQESEGEGRGGGETCTDGLTGSEDQTRHSWDTSYLSELVRDLHLNCQ